MLENNRYDEWYMNNNIDTLRSGSDA